MIRYLSSWMPNPSTCPSPPTVSPSTSPAPGRATGAPVILLHGFPEPWFCWRHQIGPLAQAGCRVLAPDQRGYNTSDKPEGVASYALDVLSADVLGLIDAAGWSSASLVGHDWGGIVAWWTALRHPERVDKLAILNAPHPVAFQRHIRSHASQLLRSWYVFYFQLPGLPEAGFRRRNWRSLCRALETTSRPGTFPEAELDRYRQAWSEPGAIRSMIHWYRAAIRHRSAPPVDPRIHVPTLLIWGPDDHFLQRESRRGQPGPLRPRPPRVDRGSHPLGPARGARAGQPHARRVSGRSSISYEPEAQARENLIYI